MRPLVAQGGAPQTQKLILKRKTFPVPVSRNKRSVSDSLFIRRKPTGLPPLLPACHKPSQYPPVRHASRRYRPCPNAGSHSIRYAERTLYFHLCYVGMTRRCPAHERNTSADKLDRYRIPSADLLAHYHPGERLLDIFEQHPPERTGSVTRLEAERRKSPRGHLRRAPAYSPSQQPVSQSARTQYRLCASRRRAKAY